MTEKTEYAILKFFYILESDVSESKSVADLETDLKKGGVAFRPTWDFDELAKRDYFEIKYVGSNQLFRLNSSGMTRFIILHKRNKSKNLLNIISTNPLISQIVGGIILIFLGFLIGKYLHIK